ncbi:hypothetical protein V6Z12_D13G129100 [Gossypium hirsutum]
MQTLLLPLPLAVQMLCYSDSGESVRYRAVIKLTRVQATKRSSVNSKTRDSSST